MPQIAHNVSLRWTMWHVGRIQHTWLAWQEQRSHQRVRRAADAVVQGAACGHVLQGTRWRSVSDATVEPPNPMLRQDGQVWGWFYERLNLNWNLFAHFTKFAETDHGCERILGLFFRWRFMIMLTDFLLIFTYFSLIFSLVPCVRL